MRIHGLKKLAIRLCLGASALLAISCAWSADTGTSETAKTITTDSGLQYVELTVGKGDAAQTGDPVSVHYTGWLQKPDGTPGTKFDSSRDRGQPFQFALGQHQVIKGWDEGVKGMKVGGERRLIIPSALAYGRNGVSGVIPPNANLIFDVELLKAR